MPPRPLIVALSGTSGMLALVIGQFIYSSVFLFHKTPDQVSSPQPPYSILCPHSSCVPKAFSAHALCTQANLGFFKLFYSPHLDFHVYALLIIPLSVCVCWFFL